jgi:ribosome maturation factor RimP
MRGDSRHGTSRPEHTGARAGRPRRAGGPQAGPASGRERGAAGRPQPGGPGGAGLPVIDTGRLTRLLDPVVHAAGMDLETVRVSGAGRRVLLRVVVDADGGVGLDDIALISREVSAVLDASDELAEAPYTLEVSSPGVDRPLTQPKHWRRALGRLVSVPVTASGPARAQSRAQSRAETARRPASIQGRVAAVSSQGVTLEVDGSRREFGYDVLGPGRVQVEFGRPAGEPGDDGGDGGEHDGY